MTRRRPSAWPTDRWRVRPLRGGLSADRFFRPSPRTSSTLPAAQPSKATRRRRTRTATPPQWSARPHERFTDTRAAWLVDRQSGLGRRRPGPGDHLRGNRAGDGRQVLEEKGRQPHARRDPRADRPGGPRGDRRARPDPARRPLAQPRPLRDRRPLHDGLQVALHRPRHHRRLAGGPARTELLRPQADRRQPSGARPTAPRSWSTSLASSTRWAPEPMPQAPGCTGRSP